MKITAIIMVACALTAIGVSQALNCEVTGHHMTMANGMQAPMRCYYTAQAELATGGALFILGGFMAIGKRRETIRSLGGLGVVLGASVALLPAVLIGVCPNPMMECNMIMSPALILTGVIAAGAGLASLLLAQRQVERAA
jgi:hypothetical protein